MGCRNDYMEPTAREKEKMNVARLIEWVYQKLDKKMPRSISVCASDFHCGLLDADELTKILCNLTKRESVIELMDLPEEKAAELRLWTIRHNAADLARKESEQIKQHKAKIRQQALDKLDDEELDALGVSREED